jgi:hypothetical protein
MTKKVPVTGETASQKFNMGSDFGACGKLKVIAESADGKKSEETEAGFTVMSSPYDGNFSRVGDTTSDFSYSTGSSNPQFTVLDYFAKKPNNDKFPLFKSNVLILKMIPTIAFNIKSDGEATLKMDWEGWQSKDKKINVAKIAGKGNVTIKPTVNGKGKFQDCKWEWNGAEIGGSGTGKVSFTDYHLIFIGPVLVPTYLKVVLGAKFDAALIVKKFHPFEFDGGKAAVNIFGRGSLGVGVDEVMALEGWIEPNGGWEWKVPPVQITKPEKAFISSKIGAKVVVFIWKWEGEALNCEWDFVKDEGKCTSPFMRSRHFAGPTLLSRDYLNKSGYARLRKSTREMREDEPTPVQTNVFPYSEADISTHDNRLYATWLSDNPNRSAINRTMAIFSIWNGTEWSELQAIDDDGTADFHPKILAFADESAIATWEDTKQVLTDTAQFEETVRSMEISVSNYEPQTQQWVGTQRLTDNDYLDRSPKLSGKNSAIVTWISNEANDILGNSDNPNQLWYAQWLNNAWSTPELVAEIPYPLIRYNTVYDGQNGYAVLSLDTDNDLQTIDDRELFTIALNNGVWGSMNQLTTDTSVDDNPQLGIDPNGQFILTWLKGGELSSIVNFDLGTKVILKTDEDGYSSNLADFKLATSTDGKLAMVWAEPSKENSSDLYAVFYDSVANIWGSSKQLTSDQETEQRITASFYGSDTLVAIYNRKQVEEITESTETDANVPVVDNTDSTDLYMVKHSIQVLDYTTIDYPIIKPVLSSKNTGSISDSTAQFYGGISVNSDDTFELTKNNVKPYDNITVNGVILPEADHVGKKADIAVIAFHRGEPSNLSCDPTNDPDGSGYYMFVKGESYNDNYCIWDVDVPAEAEDKYEEETFPYLDGNGKLICNRLEEGSIRPRSSSRSEEPPFWQRWNKNLDTLSPLFYAEELQSTMPITLYEDILSYQGHVCFYFGYWLRDLSCQDDNEICCQQPDKNCTLIFNGEPLQFSVSE